MVVAAVLTAAGFGAMALAQSALAAATAPGAGDAAAVSVPCSAATLVHDLSTVSSTSGTVTLASGCVYKLTAKNNSTDGGTGLPVINGNVTVQGNGATITRSATAPFRLFDVAAVFHASSG